MLTLAVATELGPIGPDAQIILHENKWFDISGGNAPAASPSRIAASRWVGHATERREQEAEIPADRHVIGIALQPIETVTILVGGQLIHDGNMPRGSVRVSGPGQKLRGHFRGGYDVLHLHVPNEMIAEYANSDGECGQDRAAARIGDRPVVNAVVERLAHSLMHADELGGPFGQSYVDGISLAITAELLRGTSDAAPVYRSRVSGLSKWRLKRATEYMAANLSETISLANIAAAAGLSRMHFAAQFRVATGLRPHEFLLQRRIARAQDLLLTSRMPLVEIALDVGFKTQAHFTTVFARLVGETPSIWRQRRYRASDTAIPQAA